MREILIKKHTYRNINNMEIINKTYLTIDKYEKYNLRVTQTTAFDYSSDVVFKRNRGIGAIYSYLFEYSKNYTEEIKAFNALVGI